MSHRLDWRPEGLIETWTWCDGAQSHRICHDHTRPVSTPELGTAWSAWRDRPPWFGTRADQPRYSQPPPLHTEAQNLGLGYLPGH